MDKELLEDLESLSKENRKLKTELKIYKLALRYGCLNEEYRVFALNKAINKIRGIK